jgi:hypothetical protein
MITKEDIEEAVGSSVEDSVWRFCDTRNERKIIMITKSKF